MSDLILDVRNLTIQFPQAKTNKVSVNQISFTLERGKTLGIVGESGSGKSISSIAILDLVPSPGQIINGQILFSEDTDTKPNDLRKFSAAKMQSYRGRKIAMIFQEPMSALNPVYTIGYQIVEAIKIHQKLTPAQAKNQAFALLQEVKLVPSDEEFEARYLTDRLKKISIKDYIQRQKEAIFKRYPHELSGGQLQRVMIAIAISCQPALLIADEPTTALDVTVQAGILDLLASISASRGMSMLFISHDLGVIKKIADSIIVMYEGKIVESGTTEQILNFPNHPYTKGLIACRPRLNLHTERLLTIADFMMLANKNQLINSALKVITPEAENRRINELKERKKILTVKNLSVIFGKKRLFDLPSSRFTALDNVSFELQSGETLGLVGESGCGKSTLAKAILRLIPINNGEIYFHGCKISDLPLNGKKLQEIRKEIQIVFQNPYNSLNPRLTIGDAIFEPLLIHQAKIKGNRERVKYLLERVGLDPHWWSRYPHQLSGGQRQRVCIARALALNPSFIICDESVSALDVSVQAEVLNLLKELQKESDLTYIFISHDLNVVRFMSDRIIVMNKGSFVEMGTAEMILNNPQEIYTKRLIASILN
jgi:peptide/nickel transport system ATP-binding protein